MQNKLGSGHVVTRVLEAPSRGPVDLPGIVTDVEHPTLEGSQLQLA